MVNVRLLRKKNRQSKDLSNYEKLQNYKQSTLQRLYFDYGYSDIDDINECDLLSQYFSIEHILNPQLKQSIMLDYLNRYKKYHYESRMKRGKNISIE